MVNEIREAPYVIVSPTLGCPPVLGPTSYPKTANRIEACG